MSLMRNTLMVAAVLGLAGASSAGTIVQDTGFSLGGHSTLPGAFLRMDPALAPLNAVQVEMRATGGSDTYAFTNPTAATVTFAITARDALYAFGSANLLGTSTRTFSMTLGPFREDTLVYPIATSSSPVVSTSFLSTARGDFLGNYVGTGFLGAGAQAFEEVTADDARIVVRAHAGSGAQGDPAYSGSATVTYYYGPSLGPAPEPASAVLLGLGLAGVAAASAIRRRSPASGRRPR